jgi:hypothetical protein
MQENIQKIFASLMAQLPKKLGHDDLIFDLTNLPNFAENAFETNQIAIKNGWHSYDNYYRIQQFQVSAPSEYYQILGLTLLCAVLQNRTIILYLTNPHSFIKKIKIGYDSEKLVGLTEKPLRFHHYANELQGKNPYNALDSSYYPAVFLTSDEDCYTEKDWAERDTLLFGYSAKAMTQLAEVFLDFGNPNNLQPELVFEGHAGYCNLMPMSVEMKCWLPDSMGWFDAAFE